MVRVKSLTEAHFVIMTAISLLLEDATLEGMTWILAFDFLCGHFGIGDKIVEFF